MFFGLPTIVGSAAHTREVNKEIEQHFENMEFTSAMVQPGQTASEFVYYRLPNKLEQLEDLTVELKVEANGYEEHNGKRIAYKFAFPTLGISGPVYSEVAGASNGVQ